MHRHALTDAQWRRLQRVLPRQRAGPEAIRGDRLFIDAVLYRAKTGCPWRDLPERFGPWKSVYNRFNKWARQGHWATIAGARSGCPGRDDAAALVESGTATVNASFRSFARLSDTRASGTRRT